MRSGESASDAGVGDPEVREHDRAPSRVFEPNAHRRVAVVGESCGAQLDALAAGLEGAGPSHGQG